MTKRVDAMNSNDFLRYVSRRAELADMYPKKKEDMAKEHEGFLHLLSIALRIPYSKCYIEACKEIYLERMEKGQVKGRGR